MSHTPSKVRTDELEDTDIIAQILNGRTNAFELLIRKYNARLYKMGMAIINEPTEVEDMMQTAYIKAYEHLSQFESKAKFSTWLTRILINECLLHLKKTQYCESMEEERNKKTNAELNSAQNPMNQLINKELGVALENALVQLPEIYRLVFVLREMEGFSIAETSNMLGITDVNVRVRLNRAKAMLKDTINNYYKNEGIFEFHLSRCDNMVKNVFQKLGIPYTG